MMVIGKILLQTTMRLTNPIKYCYPMMTNTKSYCEMELPFDSRYTKGDLTIMKKNFDAEDDDDDKFINIFQFNYFIQRTMGRSLDSRELYLLFAELDKDKDEHLSFADIVAHFEKQFEPQDEKRLKEVFCIYDKDEDGKIKLHELREILFHLGFFVSCNPAIEKMFNKRDHRTIRKIDFEEFKLFLKEDIPLLTKKK